MKDLWKELIGFSGGMCLSIQLLPQILKAIKTKKTMDLSYLFLMTSILGSLISHSHSLRWPKRMNPEIIK